MFLETPRFPENISHGSRGGPGYNTTVIALQSGHEQRNQNWADTRHAYDISYGLRKQADLDAVVDHFHAARGRVHGFRFKDWNDYKSTSPIGTPQFTDIQFGTGDGATVDFQMVKSYTKGALTYTREITKPVSGTILIGVNGVQKFSPADWTLDSTTGIVTFVAPPPNGQPVTWGGEFDVPCRFDTDKIDVVLDKPTLGSISIPVIEIRV